MSRLLLLVALFLFSAGASAENATPECIPVAELSPQAQGGSWTAVKGDAAVTSWRWRMKKGDRLDLRLRTETHGDHVLVFRALPASGSPSFSLEAWGVTVPHNQQARFQVEPGAGSGPVALRFDPFPLSPGFQLLELESDGDGELVLECVGARRVGPRSRTIRWPERIVTVDERPFLGVQLGTAQTDGIEIDSVYSGTAAEKIGLAAGDVIVAIDGSPTPTSQSLIDAIQSKAPGAGLDVEWLREGERFVRKATLGHRLDDDTMRRNQAAEVLDVLALQPGQRVADIGTGSGWLARAMARRVGEKGTVYAVEIDEDDVLQLHRRNMPLVLPVLSNPDDVALPENSLEVAVLHDVASHIDRSARPAFYRSVTRALTAAGRLVIFGPHGQARTMLDVLRENHFVPRDAASLENLTTEQLDDRLAEGITFLPDPAASPPTGERGSD